MFKRIFIIAMVVLGMGLVACSKDYCGELAAQACKKATGTKACMRAKTLTNKTACKNFLANIDKYIRLTNLKIDPPPRKPLVESKKVEKKPVQPAKPAVATTKTDDAATGGAAKDVPKSATAPPVPAKPAPTKPATKTVPEAKPAK